MGWEMRGANGPYLYVKERRDGRVVSRYIGRGEGAAMVADMIEADELLRDINRRTARRDLEALESSTGAAMAALAALEAATNTAIHEALQAAGYHQHKRQWRKRRGA